MGIQTRKIEPHWNYLLAIERDVERVSRFIEFDERNFDCFSLELARLLLATGAETDIVCKQLCRQVDAASTAESIGAYRNEMTAAFPAIQDFEVYMPRFGITLTPWDEWKSVTGVPIWWTAYNKTKHHRNAEYHRANLKNTLNAVGGLFIVVLYLNKHLATMGELTPSPILLRPSEKHYGGLTHGDYELGINYEL